MLALAIVGYSYYKRPAPAPTTQVNMVVPHAIAVNGNIIHVNATQLNSQQPIAPHHVLVPRTDRLSQMSPLEQLKDAIFASIKKQAFNIMPMVSSEELEEALLYLENINANTPKNKTRPIIRNAIEQLLRERSV